MKRFGQTIKLKDDAAIIARYIEYHRNVWPEVVRGLKSIGIQRMLIFIRGRQLFMYMETDDAFDIERDFPRYEASSARIKEWQDLMASMQEPVADAQPGEWWARMELVFTLE
jgi:L-rhamnose mutarotase